ncbi:MAG: F0F1 ATP synthase subunit gamma, partial [Mycoplasmataceae bacterium]|nr:F0F1 ATP synthase subunit gamma [Mycoplasmataceae bacterium]
EEIMASLQEIKSRLNSITTTKKITKAMQLVASAKLQRAKNNLESIQEYYTSVFDMFQDLLSNVKDADTLFPQGDKDVTLTIIITSDLGLCGGYNSNVLKKLVSSRKSNDQIIVLGNKGITSLKAKGISTANEYGHVGDDPNYVFASKIGEEALAKYIAGEVNKVNIIYTKFINSVTFEATQTQLLPIEASETKKEDSNNPQAVTEFEPDPKSVLINAMPLYVSAVIFGAMVESKVSEMSSRRTAMENATDNAEELIDNLGLEYNRARQASITQELNEIVAGSETG